MGKFSILLCDSDETYARRLAAGLQRQLKDCAVVNAATQYDSVQMGNGQEINLLLSSKAPDHEWRRRHENCVFLWLDDGDHQESVCCAGMNAIEKNDEVAGDFWKNRIFKYQAVSQIAKEVAKHMPKQHRVKRLTGTDTAQTWYGVVSPVRHESMIPFAVSLAQQVGKENQTLVILCMEFSGMVPLLGLVRNPGIEEFILELRQQNGVAPEQVAIPVVHRLEGFNLLNVTDNPMILYELTEADMQHLIQRIQECAQYQTVIWIAGNMMQGIGNLFHASEKVFCIEKRDAYSQCCQQEFQQFYEKLEVEPDLLKTLELPVLQGVSPGDHLLMQWNRSVIGEVVRKQLKGEVEDGATDRVYAESDLESAGYQLRDI